VDDAAQIAALKDEISSLTGGQLDMLVNNAGRNYTMPALDFEMDEVKDLFESNFFGPMRMCQAFAPLLISAKGMIVQVNSVAAIL
jgi:1-acylglycerone phosphate reductase